MSTSFFYVFRVLLRVPCLLGRRRFVGLSCHTQTHTHQKEIKTFKMFILRVSIVFRLDDALPKKTFIFVHFCIF